MRSEGFPPTPNADVHLGHPDSCAIRMVNPDGSIWAPLYTFQIIDLLDTNAARANAQQAAGGMDIAFSAQGQRRERSESTLKITRSGNLARVSAGDLGLDNGPRVSSMQEQQEQALGERVRDSQSSVYDPVVRQVNSQSDLGRSQQLSETFDNLNFLDIDPNGIDVSNFSLSDMQAMTAAPAEMARPSNQSARFSGTRDSSGIEVFQFTKEELQRIGGLKDLVSANPEAFPCHKVKKTVKPVPYNVIAFSANGDGQQCVMEAIPLPDSGTPLYQCGYCRAVKSSSSAGADGRVRIRCECGGKHKDGKARMHANWNLVKTSTQARMGLKNTKMPANHKTMGFASPPDSTPKVEVTAVSGIERISGGVGRISDDVMLHLQED
eukprot:TRINITY_DN17009_c0_g1_i1.p1 TRINITY_DN17009_c0_g1~~TRINITY_DN17009_c0_g1_i1.p1  ORF type:complete len:380 (+),score=77.62 TRINITY_DN17009_c0_g1_i1:176-1315(+)